MSLTVQAQVHLKSRPARFRAAAGRSRTLQSWPPKPQPPICATRRGRCPMRRASTSGARREGTVLYVGKAASLRKRVASYFASVNRDRKSEELVARAASIEPIVVASASEALLLEQQLIKRHRPPLNARLRDDKSYPYIAVTLADEYPRVLFTRERHRTGVRYFGPYASAQKVRTTLETLNKIFPYRPCEGPAPGRRSGVPCLDYHIGRCGAPCVGLITREEYRAVIDDVIAFLEGRTNKIERDLEQRMRDASERHQFEEAARSRNRLMAVRHLTERQAVAVGTGTYDAVALAVEGDVANVQLLAVRGGRIEERRSHYLENADGRGRGRAAGALPARLLRHAGRHPAADLRAPRGRRRRSDRRLPLPAPRRGGRAARRRARRQAARGRAWRCAMPSSACATTCCARSARARAASRGSRSCARASTSRRCRSASSASTSRTCRTRTPWPRWSCSRTAPRSAPSTAASASATRAARTTSARSPRR